MSKSITQDMKYRQSLMQYAAKYGVSRASRKYNKSRSYIYYWKARWDGSAASLACQSRRPHHHPNQHTEAELHKITSFRRRNPNIGLVVLWVKLRKSGYKRSITGLYRVLRRQGQMPEKLPNPKYIPKLIKSFKVSQHFGGFFFIIRTANLIKQSHPQFSFSNQLYSSSSGVVLL